MSQARVTRVLMVDDHALVRQAVCERLMREPDVTVVGTAGTADEAIDIVAAELPDIVLMDIDMPGMICFDAAQRMKASHPDVRFIFLSAFLHDSYIEQALKVKARGYVTKTEPLDHLVEGIHEVSRGGIYFSEEIRGRLVIDHDGVRLSETGGSRISALTSRELEVLRYVARGLSKKEIAKTMHLSVKTVENHSNNLMAKLDIHDRVELTRYAIREGLVEA